jgi:hypothetical protein
MPDVALDHVGLVGPQLHAMRQAYLRLGFQPTEPRQLMANDPTTGERRSLDQESCHIVLETGYVELSALHRPKATHHLAAYAGRYDGLHILALAPQAMAASAAHGAAAKHSATMNSPAMHTLAARVAAIGLAATPVQFATRDIDYGERHGAAKFEWFMLTPAVSPDSLVCFVDNLTPELVFQPAVQVHPNTASALLEVTYQTDTLDDSAAVFLSLAGAKLPPLPADLHEVTIDLASGRLRICTTQALADRFPGATIAPHVRMAVMTLAVEDMSALRQICAANDIPLHGDDHRLWVDASHAAGAIVEFVPAGMQAIDR